MQKSTIYSSTAVQVISSMEGTEDVFVLSHVGLLELINFQYYCLHSHMLQLPKFRQALTENQNYTY